jgi:hypothetical protein
MVQCLRELLEFSKRKDSYAVSEVAQRLVSQAFIEAIFA